MAEVVIVQDAVAGGDLAADAIERLVAAKPDAVLGLATGSTPLTTWSALEGRGIDFSRVRGFALDEYIGLPPGHPQRYREVLAREVVAPLGMNPARVRVPGDSGTIESAGEAYEREIDDAGGIDLQILGIGRSGHIGFNEPGSSLTSLTRVKALTDQTRQDNGRFFDDPDEIPTHCITQGLGTILRARHLVLLAFGEAKAEVLAAAVEGPLTASLPASVIQLHPHATVIVDEEAATRLRDADYYRFAWDNRLPAV